MIIIDGVTRNHTLLVLPQLNTYTKYVHYPVWRQNSFPKLRFSLFSVLEFLSQAIKLQLFTIT